MASKEKDQTWGVEQMNTASTTLAAVAALTILVPVPAHAARVVPGPVKILLPQATEDEQRMGSTSQLLVGPTYFIDLAPAGDVIWRGRLSRSGKLSFPVAKQRWPEHQVLVGLRVVGVKGTLSPKGKVVLTGRVKATVRGCRVTGPVRLSSSFNPGLGLPAGRPYNPTDGTFAVMSSDIPLTKTGPTCTGIPGAVSLFLTGSLL